MLELSQTTLAFGKLFLSFGCMLILLRLRVALWITIFSGCGVLALVCQLPVASWFSLPWETIQQTDFLAMQAMLFGILVLSGIQDASGQSKRFVEHLEQHVRWPRLRLILFPALVGLLPMPGGALFSCPMLETASRGMQLDDKRKTLINYWFRHIWEPTWPLYPGFILVCSLLGVSLITLIQYTFPLALFSLATGWFFYLRNIPVTEETASIATKDQARAPFTAILLEALPLIVTIAGAGVFSFVLQYTAPDIPTQASFILSLLLGIIIALFQAKGKKLSVPLLRIVCNANLFRMLLLVYAVFVFKDIIKHGGLIEHMSHLGENTFLVYALFIILPLLCGLLTGVMVGFVGACFPILIAIISQPGMEAQALPLIIAAMLAGHAGQLLSPLHICLVVSCEYFTTPLSAVWKSLIAPAVVQICYGIAWAYILFLAGARL